MLKLFLNINIADFFSDSEYYIFRAVTSIKKSGKYKLRNYGTLSFSRARELLLKVWISPKLGFIALGLGALLRLCQCWCEWQIVQEAWTGYVEHYWHAM